MRRPAGFGAVVPYIFADDCDGYVTFLTEAFGAVEIGQSLRPDGAIANVQLRFDDTMIMLSETAAGFPASRLSLYLYVDSADRAMARAIAAGAEPIMVVDDMPYGDRQGGVRDPRGTLWWISERLVDAPYF
ncbi:MAG TPA: VOC family protein [Sphingomonas sp.]|jgi:PhnB protein|uniref:VOC family protein n=1 Tax=Sphingomonas sp. TaxID=28214 RepID=UPI002EDBB4FD